MPMKFHGQQLERILKRLVDEWLLNGPGVAILQGFPGCGKTQIAAAAASKAPRSLEPIVVQDDWSDPSLDLFIEIAIALDGAGISALLQEFDRGAQANLGRALLGILRNEQILIVIDEFQRLFTKNSTAPPKPWQSLVENLNNSPNPRGRLLLISNRAIKSARWCESGLNEELRGLPDTEAEQLFSELLESQGVAAKVPAEERRDIVHRLGGNPRALRTLATSLRSEALSALMSSAPDLSTTGDVVLHAQLVEEFEQELLECALPKLEADLLKFMRWLSVHRRPFHKEAMAQFTGGLIPLEELRKELFDRFLLEQTAGGDTPHPLAREISVSRLRTEPGEWVQAHSLAANYHFRPFKAKQLSGPSMLVASYTELRHHLYEAGRIDELREAGERLTKYALSQITLATPVPSREEALEERIALLSRIPDDQRPKALEYHLARCFLRRGAMGDKERALNHARAGTGRHPDSSPWILRLDLEFEIHGIHFARPLISEALVKMGTDGDASPIYQRGAELMAKANEIDDAIKLLETGIAVPGMTSLSSLYHSCAELMAKANRLDDAIKLLETGIAVPGMTSLSSLYQSCAELMAKVNRLDDAIKLLEKGIAVVPPAANLFSLYQSCAELMAG